jgi:hypothetical protein
MNIIRKGQVQGVGKGDIPSQKAFLAKHFTPLCTFLADERSLPGKSVRNGKIRPETS